MKNILIFGTLVLLFSISCRKTNSLSANQFQKQDYPVNVGNWWRYQVYDFYANYMDTLILKIVSKTQSGDTARYRCELFEKGSIVDSGYYLIANSSIAYAGLNADYSYFGNVSFVFPFNDGGSWIGNNVKDTVSVTGMVDSFVILGQTYSPVYTLKRAYYLVGGYKYIQDLMISPKVGIIYQSLDVFDGFPVQKQTFQLIDYHLE